MTIIDHDTYGEPPVAGLLSRTYQKTRDALAGTPVTGWRWRRPTDVCPGWCAKDHTCTVRPDIRGPMSEHRSPITTFRPEYGSMTCTRVASLTGPPRVEMRIQVRVSDTSERLALAQSVYLPIVVDRSVRALLAELELASRVRAMEFRHRREMEELLASHSRPALPRSWA